MPFVWLQDGAPSLMQRVRHARMQLLPDAHCLHVLTAACVHLEIMRVQKPETPDFSGVF